MPKSHKAVSTFFFSVPPKGGTSAACTLPAADPATLVPITTARLSQLPDSRK